MSKATDAKNLIITLIIFAALLGIVLTARAEFGASYEVCAIVEGPGVSKTGYLSDYFDKFKDSPGDTKAYYLEGEEPGGTLLVMGELIPMSLPVCWAQSCSLRMLR